MLDYITLVFSQGWVGSACEYKVLNEHCIKSTSEWMIKNNQSNLKTSIVLLP